MNIVVNTVVTIISAACAVPLIARPTSDTFTKAVRSVTLATLVMATVSEIGRGLPGFLIALDAVGVVLWATALCMCFAPRSRRAPR